MAGLNVATESLAAPCITQVLHYRYLFILLAIALLLLIDQALVQPQLARLSVAAPRINMAGRQRMLSQKLAKEALAMRSEQEIFNREHWRRSFRETLALWRDSHQRLAEDVGGPTVTTTSEELALLDEDFNAMSLAATNVLNTNNVDAAIAHLLQHSDHYLPRMDRIVGLYQAEAERRARTLRFWGLLGAASVLALIVGLGLVVLRPATRMIQRQMEGLEQCVQDRTGELTVTNSSLVREIEGRHEVEQRNTELSSQLAHLQRVSSLGQLATGLAHELNQPLAAILNYSETCDLLLSSDVPDLKAIRQKLHAIGEGASRAGEIIRNMRSFLHPGLKPLADADLHGLIRDVVMLSQPEFVQQQIAFEVDVARGLPPVRIDAVQIQQVLMNLIQNGVQAMQESPASERRLRISARLIGEQVRIEVADSGGGFGNRDPESLFAPFFTTKVSGLGMGLSIVRSIVHAHGGRVEASNCKGGAAVSFTIPLNPEYEGVVRTESHCVCR